MKKVFSLFLCLCLLGSLAVACAFVMNAAADDLVVTVGSKFEYNEQTVQDDMLRWRRGELDKDGLWSYRYRIVAKDTYGIMSYAAAGFDGGYYSFNGQAATGNGSLDYVLVRYYGRNFHPGTGGDVCKVFTCPASGKVKISTTIARASEVNPEDPSANGTSFAIYLRTSPTEKTLIYPTGGAEYETLTSTVPLTPEVEIDVAKNNQIVFQIGSCGNRGSDAVDMSNSVEYLSLSSTADGEDCDATTTTTTKTPTSTITDNGSHSITVPGPKPDKTPVGLIIGIVAAVVVVVGVVVVFVVKKKKS